MKTTFRRVCAAILIVMLLLFMFESYIYASERTPETYQLRCLSLDFSREALHAYDWAYDENGFLNGLFYEEGKQGERTVAFSKKIPSGIYELCNFQKERIQFAVIDEIVYQECEAEIYYHGKGTDETGEDMPIGGAKFQVVAEENIYLPKPDGNPCLLYRKGEIVAEVITGQDGRGHCAGFYPGKYKIVETAAGKEIVLKQTEKCFEILPRVQTVSPEILVIGCECE